MICEHDTLKRKCRICDLEEEVRALREALEEIKAKEWELAGEQTPSYLIADNALQSM